jgi:hypothetical protein
MRLGVVARVTTSLIHRCSKVRGDEAIQDKMLNLKIEKFLD